MHSNTVALLVGAAQAPPPDRRSSDAPPDGWTGGDEADDSRPLQVQSLGARDGRRIDVSGELDLAGRDVLARCCCAGSEPAVVVDLSKLVFMDCGGYAALAQARLGLGLRHRTITFVGASGQPARLLELIAKL